MATLIVNRSDSRCGECGRGADPHQLRHDQVLGYYTDENRPEPCMALFDSIRSDYSDLKVALTAMRPDLRWVGFDA